MLAGTAPHFSSGMTRGDNTDSCEETYLATAGPNGTR